MYFFFFILYFFYINSIKRDFYNVAHLNIRSLVPKIDNIKQLLRSNKYDILALSETWLDTSVSNNSISIDNYSLVRRDRVGARGGGVCISIKQGISFKKIQTAPTLEQLCISISTSSGNLPLCVLYRPPNQSVNVFIDELETTVSILMQLSNNFLILGDTNIDLLRPDLSAAIAYNNFLDVLGLFQVVLSPARVTGVSCTLIDHIVVSCENLVNSVSVVNVDVSDHELICCRVMIKKPKQEQFFHTYRDFASFNADQFLADLMASNLECIFYIADIDKKIQIFTNTILKLFNYYAPYKTARISKPPAPWLTPNLKHLMHLRDQAKIKFKRTKRDADWNYYKTLRNYTKTAIESEKKAYYNLKFRNKNPKILWK